MNTIKEVARIAGVSSSTVSRVFSGRIVVNDDTKKKVLDAAKQLDYHPNPFAQGLKGVSIKTIGLIIPNVRDLVFPAAIRGIEDTANRQGYTVVLCNTDEDIEKEKFYINNLRRRLIDGFIICTARPGHDHLSALHDEGFQAVYLNRRPEKQGDYVTIDNYRGGYDATTYLLSRGLKKIAMINGIMALAIYQERYQGYCQALADAGIDLDEALVVHENYDWEDGYKAMEELLKSGLQPDAVFASTDPKAIGVIRAIKDAGLRVPEDISVIGFDNSDIAPLIDPPLTTIAQPFYEMGVSACQRLIKMIETGGKAKAKAKVFTGELVIRKSVK